MGDNFEMLGVMVPASDKSRIREIASKNRMTLSDVARMLISAGLDRESLAMRL